MKHVLFGLFVAAAPAAVQALEEPFSPRPYLREIIVLQRYAEMCAEDRVSVVTRLRESLERVLVERALFLGDRRPSDDIKADVTRYLENGDEQARKAYPGPTICAAASLDQAIASIKDLSSADLTEDLQTYISQPPVRNTRYPALLNEELRSEAHPSSQSRILVSILSDLKKDEGCMEGTLLDIAVKARKEERVQNLPPFILPPVRIEETWQFACSDDAQVEATVSFMQDSDGPVGEFSVDLSN